MAQLPIYRQQQNISLGTPDQVKNVDKVDYTFQTSKTLQETGNLLMGLAAQWQESKDAVENLDGKNKLNSGITAILDEAANYNDYSTPEQLSQKQNELTQKMNDLVPNIVSGFSNNQKAREFEMNGQYATEQNIYKLQEIFRSKYGDMYNANLMETADTALKNFTKTGNEAFKKEYFDAIDTGVQAGYLDRSQAEKLRLSTDEWNYDFAYSQILENPYAKISEETLSKINPVKQRTLRNFQRTEIKRAQAEAEIAATNAYFKNPTQANLKRLYKANPKLRGSKQLENISNSQPNFNAVTSYEGMSEALSYVKELASMPTRTAEEKRAYAKKAMEVGIAIDKMQVRDKDHKEGVISLNDKQKLVKMIYDDMINDNFKNQLKNMPDLSKEWSSEFNKDYQKLQSDLLKADMEFQKIRKLPNVSKDSKIYKDAEAKYQKAWKARHYYIGYNDAANKNRAANAPIGVTKKMAQLQREAAENMLKAYTSGNIQEANKIKENYGQQMVRLKYWNIPALQKQNIKAGDKFSVNGKIYSFQGFSKNDVIVEVH